MTTYCLDFDASRNTFIAVPMIGAGPDDVLVLAGDCEYDARWFADRCGLTLVN